MSSKNWKPWWERVSDFDTPHEKEEFMKGIAGNRPMSSKSSAILIGVIAGYLGGKASQRKGKK